MAALALPPSIAAADPYEPNDSSLAATGPLAFGQPLSAALEGPGDRDFFYFYVTGPAAVQVELAVNNIGGGEGTSDVDAAILDATGTQLAGQAFIRDGETRAVVASLEPQKYFVEVKPGEGAGDSYSLSPGGAAGAFGSYAEIAGRCEAAEKAVTADRVHVSRAKLKLQRETARLRRSRYSGRAARAKARAAQAKARSLIKKRRRALVQARRSRQPWCSIAP